MKTLYTKIKNTLLKDVENEAESKDLAVLVRFLTLICILHYLLMIFPISKTGNILISLLLIFELGILLGAFICTYENRTMTGVWIFNTIIIIMSALLSIFVGWGFFFIPIVFTTILLVFFPLHVTMRTKINYSILCGIIIFALGIGSYFLPAKTTLSLATRIQLLALNISLSFFSFTTIAYSFCIKYTKTEEKILQYNKRLEYLVKTDALTSLWNRRAMTEHLNHLVNSYNKTQKDFSLAILDIDFFKKVNDEYGHGVGDYILQAISELMNEYMEGKGHVSRWGGEEFLLTFEGMDFQRAVSYLEQLRLRIEQQDFSYKGLKLHITITGGIEEYQSHVGLGHALTKADVKLYSGKTSGRNKIVSI